MTSAASSRSIDAERIVAAAMTLVADAGLDRLTLRDLAQAVGKSTTVIVNLFGARAGLVEAIAATAFEQDSAYHDAFFADVQGLALSRDGLIALIHRYLRERAGASASFVRVWEDLLIAHERDDFTAALLERWEAMRRDAWSAYLSRTPDLSPYGGVLAAYLVIEQFYIGALGGRADYEMIAAEGLGGLVDHMLGHGDGEARVTESYVAAMIIPKAPSDGLEPDSAKLKLLEAGADQILMGGVASVTNRSVSTTVGTSTSTIAYHWSDMRRFIIDTVWHAVFRDIPGYLDFRHPTRKGPPDLRGWGELMARTLRVGGGERDGFYVIYARLIAQVCLQARRDPAYQDLAMILRGPEGGGTHINRAELWPAQFDLTRLAATRFALWIKGSALVGAATGRSAASTQLQDVAEILVSHRQS